MYYIYLDFPGNTTTYHIISTANPINQPWEVDFNGSGARAGTPDENYVNQMVAAKNVNPVSDFSELLYFSSVPNSTSGGYVSVYNIRTNYWYGMAGSGNVKTLGFLSSNIIFEETSKFGLWQMQYPSTPSTAFNRQWSVNATAINQVTAFNKGYYVATTNGLYYWYPTLTGWKEFKTFTDEPYVVDWIQNINNTLYVDTPNLGVLKSYTTPSGKNGFSPMASLSSPGLTVSSIQERLGVIYAFTNKGVYQSFDNGLTFQKNQDLANVNIPAPNQNSIASEGNNIAIVANGYAYKSSDGGLTFTATKL